MRRDEPGHCSGRDPLRKARSRLGSGVRELDPALDPERGARRGAEGRGRELPARPGLVLVETVRAQVRLGLAEREQRAGRVGSADQA